MDLAVLAIQLVIGAGLAQAPGEIPAWARPDSLESSVAHLQAEARGGGENPACRAEFCQPRVSIPGREQEFDTRGKRTELALAFVDGLRIGVVSGIARAVNTSGLLVDYQPPQLDSTSTGRGGLGKLNVGLRWRLDAWNGPVWLGLAR
jgi:hypothetical protein